MTSDNCKSQIDYLDLKIIKLKFKLILHLRFNLRFEIWDFTIRQSSFCMYYKKKFVYRVAEAKPWYKCEYTFFYGQMLGIDRYVILWYFLLTCKVSRKKPKPSFFFKLRKKYCKWSSRRNYAHRLQDHWFHRIYLYVQIFRYIVRSKNWK